METVRRRCAGGIVIGDGGTIALVRNMKETKWFFPKGHLEDGEEDETASRREIYEETGLSNLELLDDLGEYERYRILIDGSNDLSELKEIKMYLFAAEPHATLSPTVENEIEECRWMPYAQVGESLQNDKDRIWFASVFDRVREAIQRD
jgi:8-oxo-dGTP pyrophosphatase MutT (NUDIX family)